MTFLTDDDIAELFNAEPASPQLKVIISLMRRLLEAYAIKSDDTLREVERDLSNLETKTFVQLTAYTVMPLAKYGHQLKDIVNSLDDGSPGLDMEYLARTLCKVIGSNVAFCGAAGMLSRRVDGERNSRRGITFGFLVTSGLAGLVFWPLGLAGLALSTIPGCGWYLKAQEYDQVEDMGKFGKEVDILGSCCRTYILLVMTKAGSFFESGTPQYDSYKRLLHKIYGIDLDSEDFEMNSFLKTKGTEIFHKVEVIRGMVLKHAKDYGVQPTLGEWK